MYDKREGKGESILVREGNRKRVIGEKIWSRGFSSMKNINSIISLHNITNLTSKKIEYTPPPPETNFVFKNGGKAREY